MDKLSLESMPLNLFCMLQTVVFHRTLSLQVILGLIFVLCGMDGTMIWWLSCLPRMNVGLKVIVNFILLL
ncbi:hypothetical protein WN944_027083 [Citrus x changshan-huyou]|uniref:Uncharacterized protein n=1 Tax=Citrus x changshan-huyou TaxID=2935761 RepID=A0AAP0LHZ0_9ROSI